MFNSLGGTLGPMYESLTSSGGGPVQKVKKERKLSLLLRRSSEPLHCAGVESILLSHDEESLYTASRDATVRSWAISQDDSVQWQATFEGHSNWVTDVVSVEDRLATSSSDCSISIWNAKGRGVQKPAVTLYGHSDYVTCLAAARKAPCIVSAGLRGQVYVWDLNVITGSGGKSELLRRNHPSPLGSVYAVGISANASIVATGSPEGLLRITDSRSPDKSVNLRGHTDNIRAIVLNENGTHCLSASSDSTIRLWDLGQQRCVQSLAVHTDSVWTLLASPDFSIVYSGGRDCCVYRTHLSTRSSELLLEEKDPINKLAMGSDGLLWCATKSSTVKCYNVRGPKWVSGHSGGAIPPPSPRTPSRTASGRIFHAGPSPQVRQRQRLGQMEGEQESCKLHAEIRGIPPLSRFATLLDKRHILTQDHDSNVELWDVPRGARVQFYGKADLASIEKELFTPNSLAPWFTADVKLGSLAIHLELASCFAAAVTAGRQYGFMSSNLSVFQGVGIRLQEIYARDLGDEDCADDIKYNYGEHMLKAALAKWLQGISSEYVASGDTDGVTANGLANAASVFQLEGGVSPLLIGQRPQASSSEQVFRPWTKAVNEMNGSERELLPAWVKDAVLHSKYPSQPELKCAFMLVPSEGSGLPSLIQSRLHAPRILRMKKVADYVIQKLEAESLNFVPRATYYNPTWQSEEERRRESDLQAGLADMKELEFLCNGQAVPFDLSLGAVRSFLWRRSDSPIINFRVYTPGKPAPRAVIRPP